MPRKTGNTLTTSELKYVRDCFGKGDDKRFLCIVEDFSNFVLHEIQIAACDASLMKMGH